jgi:tripartite-type tricarboxylate transporter receptor subunit TctC
MLTLVAVLGATAGAVAAQEKFPNRPIDFICNWGPGGGADQMARLLGHLSERTLGVAMPVTNIPGASGNTGLAKIVTDDPDGYAVSVFTGITLAAWAMRIATYKIDDFEWLVRLESVPSYLFVRSDSPFKTAQDLLQAATKQNIKIATAGYGTLDDFAVRFLARKGLRVINAPFAKPGERYAAPLGGHVDVLYEEAGDVRKFLDAKQLRPLLVFDSRRNPAFPDVPTAQELGYPIAFFNWRGVVAKKGTPPDRIRVLTDAFTKAAESPQWKAFCKAEDCQPDSFMKGEDFRKWVVAEFDGLSRFAKEYGLIK